MTSVISWNMGGAIGFSAKKHADGWRWLQGAEVDVALVQEAVIPVDWRDNWTGMVHHPKWGRKWGTAILTRRVPLDVTPLSGQQPWLGERIGATAIARSPSGIWLCSFHCHASQIDNGDVKRIGVNGVPVCVSGQVWEQDVLFHELASIFEGEQFVAGGDLNSALTLDKPPRQQTNRQLFSNLRSAGFVDCRPRSTAEQATFTRRGRSHQLDHVYTDTRTNSTMRSWNVDRSPLERGLSDHAAVVVEFDQPLE